MKFKQLFSFSKSSNSHLANEFWQWFSKHQESFFRIIQSGDKVDERFLDQVSPKLTNVNLQFFCLCGMYDEDTAELVVTSDGDIKTFVFVEEFIGEAPTLNGWRFTALKPAGELTSFTTTISGIDFNDKTLQFYPVIDQDYPDEIALVFQHSRYDSGKETDFYNGTYIYLENALGELTMASLIDSLRVEGSSASKELIPLHKLSEYLHWRKKEFIEKYEDIRHSTEKDTYQSFNGKTDSGQTLLAMMNRNLLHWDMKPSHPWMLVITIAYDGTHNNGLPVVGDYDAMDIFENRIAAKLTPYQGYLNIGRTTGGSRRVNYWAVKDFRVASKVMHQFIKENKTGLSIIYDIYRDKYWKTLQQFMSK